MDKRDAAYTQARTDVLSEMLRAGAFDMPEEQRHDLVAATVRGMAARYPALGDALEHWLTGEMIEARYAAATLALAARDGLGTEGEDS